jgi:thymidylate synthase (FAD)
MIHEEFEHLQWKKIPVLDDGFVCLVDLMGSDMAVVQAARVSYGKDARDELQREWLGIEQGLNDPADTPPEVLAIARQRQLEIEREQDRMEKDGRTLLRYLMRHHHTTPFEMAEVKILVRVPMDCWRQWIRHRTANVNEYSTRYAEAIDSMQTTPADQWRLQSGANKQGSSGLLEEWPADLKPEGESLLTAGSYLSVQEKNFQQRAQQLYQQRLRFGVAREQARKDLPLSTYTEAYWKCDLHNILNFLRLRMDSHAQQEIREYATAIGEQIIKPLFPCVWEAFVDYRLQSMQLSRLDVVGIQMLHNGNAMSHVLESIFSNERERGEFLTKLERLGFKR